MPTYINKKCLLPNCGKELIKEQKKFCSSSCSAKYNNGRRPKRSNESRKKISDALKSYHAWLKEFNMLDTIRGDNNACCTHGNNSLKMRECTACHKPFYGKRKTCSETCKRERSRQQAIINLKKNRANYKGRSSRSYMEISFRDWLLSHGITNGINGFLEEIHFKHIYNNKTKNGWIDFLFPKRKLIIELDGTHHLKRQDLDHIRDEYLRTRGYEIIRIQQREYIRGIRIPEVAKLLGIIGPPNK